MARLVKKLRHLKVHLVGIGGADARTYARHGYFGAHEDADRPWHLRLLRGLRREPSELLFDIG